MTTPIPLTTTSGPSSAVVGTVSASNPNPTTNGLLISATPTSTTPVLRSKKYEIADIEESPDSPPPSDLSAQSSSDNVTKEAALMQEYPQFPSSVIPGHYGRSHFQQPLESYSESHLQAGGGPHPSFSSLIPEFYSATPEPGTEYGYHQAPSYHPYPANSRQGSVLSGGMQQPGHAHHTHYDPRVGSTSSITRHPSVPNMPSLSGLQGGGAPADQPQRNYHTTSALYEYHYPSILPDGYSQHPYPPQATPTTATMRTVNPQPKPHPPPPTTHPSTGPYNHAQAPPRPQGLPNLPTLADVPQPDLLAKAFMVFLHAMGGVFRDPAFGPLLDTLENHFGPFTSSSLHSNTGLSESGIGTRQGSFSPPPTAHAQQEDGTVLICGTPEKLREEADLADQTHRTKQATSTSGTPEKHLQDELDEDKMSFNEQMHQ